jgi:hypothetical protein
MVGEAALAAAQDAWSARRKLYYKTVFRKNAATHLHRGLDPHMCYILVSGKTAFKLTPPLYQMDVGQDIAALGAESKWLRGALGMLAGEVAETGVLTHAQEARARKLDAGLKASDARLEALKRFADARRSQHSDRASQLRADYAAVRSRLAVAERQKAEAYGDRDQAATATSSYTQNVASYVELNEEALRLARQIDAAEAAGEPHALHRLLQAGTVDDNPSVKDIVVNLSGNSNGTAHAALKVIRKEPKPQHQKRSKESKPSVRT